MQLLTVSVLKFKEFGSRISPFNCFYHCDFTNHLLVLLILEQKKYFPAPVLPTMPTCQGMGWHGLFQPGLARRQATEGSWTCTQGPSIYHHLLCIRPSICPSVLPSAQPVHISIHQSAQPSVCEFVSIFPHPDISLPSFHSFPHPSFCSFILPSFPILSSTPLHHSHLPFHPMSPVNVPSFSQSPFLLSYPSFQLH